jgi:lactosylceramide 4-alpha-galactosyltransferase
MALNLQKYSNTNGKHLVIPILLTIIYFIASMIILNNNYKFFLFAPLCLTLVILKLLWDKSNHVLSLIFTFSVVASIAILLMLSNKNNMAHELQLLYNRYQYYNDSTHNMFIHLATTSQYNVFFLETNLERNEFSTKQLCAIESAAKANPKGKIFISSIKSEFLNLNLIKQYPNLIWLKFKPVELFRNTPLWTWWTNGQVFSSPYMSAHISDAARLAILFKYGGFYSDLDTIAVKSFETLSLKSGAGYLNENGDSLGNGFLHFTKGHSFLEFLMKEFQYKYNPSYWGGNGPTLFIDTMKIYCQFDDFFQVLMNKKLNDTNIKTVGRKCQDLIIYPETFFYPYTYKNGELDILFGKNAIINVSKIIDSYSIHFYGSLSNKYHVGIHDFSFYEYLAAQNCPIIYEHVKKNEIKFY